MTEIFEVSSAEQIILVKKLIIEYAEELNEDLQFQGFREELDELPGKYSQPEGALLIAYYNKIPAGCIALRKLENNICEMKRLYVRKDFRAYGIGKTLTEKLILAAKQKGYKIMRLDTLEKLMSANNLYQKLGFKKIPAYYYNPLEGVIYWELEL